MNKIWLTCLVCVGLAQLTFGSEDDRESETMIAKGTFTVELLPQEDVDAPAERFVINKTYSGDMVGKGVGQMLSKHVENGPAVYYAVEEFSGSINGKDGALTLLHIGEMANGSEQLNIKILEGSGSGELEGVSGSMTINRDSGGHEYGLEYEL